MHKQIENLSIEQMREIVSGAPEGASHIRRGIYFKYGNPVEWHYWEENQWKFTSSDITKSVFLIDLNNLRTAIAKHDEFKVGDWVVGKEPRLHCQVFTITEIEDNFYVTLNGFFYSNFNLIRLATPEEIAAGHRIDDTTDHVTDIRNHVSPSTRVVDL